MLVGASGTLLTLMMARAMNRSVANVLFGAFGQVSEAAPRRPRARTAAPCAARRAEDVAVMLAYAHKVVFVPGYGLAVAQAQHDVRQLADLLESKGVEVSYAIHPVAGRMPGHMNVLLAEANVPYDAAEGDGRGEPASSRAPTSRSSSARTTSSTPTRATTRARRSTACRSSTSTTRRPSSSSSAR